MTKGGVVSRASLLVAAAAFAVTRALSLRARAEPLYAALAGVAAFVAVLCAARWRGGVLGSEPEEEPDACAGASAARGQAERAANSGGGRKGGERAIGRTGTRG
jgi:hypothetical protein